MQKYISSVLDLYGNVIMEAKIRVQTLAGQDAVIYNSNGTTDVLANPVSIQSSGRFAFYAPNGRYNLLIYVDNVLIDQTLDHLIFDPADSTVVTLTLLNSWIAYDPAGTTVLIPKATVRPDKVVMLEGSLKNGVITVGTVLATLPVGMRPAAECLFPVILNGNGLGVIRVLPNGDIKAESALNGQATSLDGIVFRAA